MLLRLALLAITAIAAFAGTWLIRRNAASLGLVQTPNARSSHKVPTPRGGGVGIVVGGTLAMLAAAIFSGWPYQLGLVVSLVVAGIGFADDRWSLPARWRLLAQIVLVGVTVWWAVALPVVAERSGLPIPALAFGVLALIGGVYWINLFNFMDGIDGIAASQAIFMCCGAALLALLRQPAVADETLFVLLLAIAAAAVGFLVLNWPPAKIFMGDAGSTYLGYTIFLLALLTIAEGWLTLPQWLILGALFVADASVTLARRLLNRERVFEAHRRHAYQVLSRRLASHLKVTVGFIAVNLIWLLPLAWLSTQAGWSWGAVVVAYVPLIGLALYFGAGAPERPAVEQA